MVEESVLNKIILWVTLIFFVILFFFVFYGSGQGLMGKIAKLALGAERFLPVESQKSGNSNKQSTEWLKILQEYQQKKCIVNQYTCKAENLGCQCFSAGGRQNKEKPDTCDSQKSYCYDGVYGCSDKGPDSGDNLAVCKQTLADNFRLANKCKVDKNTCKIISAPCSCSNLGGTTYVCSEGQYCYDRQIGCSSESSDKPLYADYCQKSNKN